MNSRRRGTIFTTEYGFCRQLGGVALNNAVTQMRLTETEIARYLQNKLDSGVSPVAVAKYRTPLYRLYDWAGEDKELSPHRMQAWRTSLEAYGYGKITIQNYVTVANDFLRGAGHPELCIAKPMQNDLTGRTFGYLTAIEPTGRRSRKYVVWRCRCRCGRELEVPSGLLLEGNTTSCGCLKREVLNHANRYEEGTQLSKALAERVHNPQTVSGYVGVQPKRDKWIAYINYKGVHYHLGTYTNIEDAVKARARAKEAVMEDAARIFEETDHLYGEAPHRPPKPEKETIPAPEPAEIPARRSDNTSGQTGVTLKKGKWCATISFRGYRYRLGVYERLEDAVAARKRAEALVKAGDLQTLNAISVNGPKENAHLPAEEQEKKKELRI